MRRFSFPSFDQLYMELAVGVAFHSRCTRKHVGAVLARDNRIISTGYNGPPTDLRDCHEAFGPRGCPRDAHGSCSLAVHAEQSAIMYAVKGGFDVAGAILYTTLSPCVSCARLIHDVGVQRVFYLGTYSEYKGLKKDEGVDLLETLGVEVRAYEGRIRVERPPRI